MSQPFAVFDIDGTLIRWQLYHALVDALIKLGIFDRTHFSEVKAARMKWKQRLHEESFKDYEHSLIKSFEVLLTELTADQFEQAAAKVFEEYKDQVYTYTRDLVKSLKKKGYLIFAISASQAELVGKIADYYGFDDFAGSKYEIKNGKFTGKKEIAKENKHIILAELVKKHRATYKNSIAVGDSEGDISMLKAVEHPIVFNPSKKLYQEAKQAGWQIVVERKNVIYELKRSDGKYILA